MKSRSSTDTGTNGPGRGRAVFLMFLASLLLVSACARGGKNTEGKSDAFINNPFEFEILKNYSDPFASIGEIRNNTVRCPLEKENIADSAFCFIRIIEYEGLTVRVFSFDVLQGGTAEYLVTGRCIQLTNGLSVGSSKSEVRKKLGRPLKIQGDSWIWRSGDLHNFLVFTFSLDAVTQIRWHEERVPSYKGTVVWETTY
jgi:hypothetical protein